MSEFSRVGRRPELDVVLREMAVTIARNFIEGNFASLSEETKDVLLTMSFELDAAADVSRLGAPQ